MRESLRAGRDSSDGDNYDSDVDPRYKTSESSDSDTEDESVVHGRAKKKKVKRVRKTSRLAGHGKVPIQESRNYAEALPQEEEENGDA